MKELFLCYDKIFKELESDLYTIPEEYIDQCPRCRYKFEYIKPLIKRYYCGSCTADITDGYIRILFNNLSREEAINIYEGNIKYSKEQIEFIKNEIENSYKRSCELAVDNEEEINAEELLIELQKVWEDREEPRNVFKDLNVDDLDRLIDFEGNEDD